MTECMESKILVVGAGVAGLSAALYLQRSGRMVTVIDPLPPGSATSYGNAGLISATTAVPIAMPGMLHQVPRWLLDPQGPLMVRPLHLIKALPWLLRWIHASRWCRVLRISDAMHALHRETFACWRELLGGDVASKLIFRTGQVRISQSAAATPLECALFERQGTATQSLTTGDLQDIYPGLHADGWSGVLIKDNGHTINPQGLVDLLAQALIQEGGSLIRGDVLRIQPLKPGFQVVTNEGQYRAPRVVVAAGIWSKALLQPLGVRLPLESERGYHAMLPSPEVRLAVPLIIKDDGFVLTTMQAGLRVAGTVEIAGVKASPNEFRAGLLVRKAQRLFPALGGGAFKPWMGHRPSTPDSLPIVGELRQHPGLFAMVGHGHFGMTTSGPSARLLTRLINRTAPGIDPVPYSPLRF